MNEDQRIEKSNSAPQAAHRNLCLEAALQCAMEGRYVLPVHSIAEGGICTCGNPKCEHPGKHPRTKNGVLDASIDEDQIRRWYRMWPDSNIGIATGQKSGLLIIDVDGPDGEESIREYERKNGKLPDTLQCLTGKGQHFYFKHPGILIKNRVRVLPGIDIRSDGGYIVAPPSKHISGRNYVFEVSTQELKPAEIPPQLLELLIKGQTSPPKGASLSEKILEGTRNQTLTSIAGSLRSREANFETIKAALDSINQLRCDPPLPPEDVEKIAKSVSNYSVKDDPMHLSLLSQLARVKEWPKASSDKVFYGLAGDIVRLIEPHSEADPMALLGQLLIAFGNVIGRCAHFCAEGTQHFLNEYIVIVGQTSKGRKGSAWAQIRRLFQTVADKWSMNRLQSGLSTGEGLIWSVRDAVEKVEPIRDKSSGDVVDHRIIVIDPGIEDKRLLAFAPEFACTLRSIDRNGNTLSAILREAWDMGNLQTLTKNSPAKATSCHVSVIAHITSDELRRELTRTEIANGFANRFMFLMARRSKCLPEGGQVESVDFSHLITRLNQAIEFASRVYEMHRDAAAKELWSKVYPELSEGKPGLFGALLGRAEAHVMRLAAAYALLDCCAEIRLPHLEAALAFWGYCQESIAFVFGDTLGNPFADAILLELKTHRSVMTLTEINDLLGKHVKSDQIGPALAMLQSMKLIEIEQVKTGGRPAIRIVLKRPESYGKKD